MKKIALFTLLVLGVIGLVVVLASSSVTKGKVGIKAATACTKPGTPQCLPRIGYLDTDDTMWTDELLDGEVVMVNFWATWCAPCKHEIPALTEVYKQYKDQGFVLLGVLMDDPNDDELKHFARQWNLDYPVVRGDQDILLAFDYPSKIPATFIYDRGGKRRFKRLGAVSQEELADVLGELLAEPAPQ